MRDWGENIGKVGNECKSMLVNKLVLTMVLHPAFFFFFFKDYIQYVQKTIYLEEKWEKNLSNSYH